MAQAGALTTVSLTTVARGTLAPLPLEELQQLAAVFGMVKTDYVEPVDEKKLITEAISGTVASLDPHSQYFIVFKEFKEGTSGRFVGVGIEITQEDGLVEPSPRSRDRHFGWPTNGSITRIDDAPVKGMTLNESVKRMRGEPNTKAVLTLFRKEENRTFTITDSGRNQAAIRARQTGGARLCRIRVSQFQENTVEDFARKLNEI